MDSYDQEQADKAILTKLHACICGCGRDVGEVNTICKTCWRKDHPHPFLYVARVHTQEERRMARIRGASWGVFMAYQSHENATGLAEPILLHKAHTEQGALRVLAMFYRDDAEGKRLLADIPQVKEEL